MADLFYNVMEFGAVADGRIYDTSAIQKAIDTCFNAGGGTVVIPSGKYLTGPFEMKSHVTLYLESGAVILASIRVDDYFVTHTSVESPRIGLVFSRDSKHMAIMGKGIIDCRGTAFFDTETPHEYGGFDPAATRQGDRYRNHENGIEDGPYEPVDRPGNLVQFLRCEDVALHDITILDSPNWTVHFGHCSNIKVNGITIKSDLLIPNSDGIHCTLCKDVVISDCHIEGGDDCIALTAFGEPGDKTENLLVTNCTLVSRSAGIRVGYGRNDIRNCLFNNLTIKSNRGIGVFQRNEGNISNIFFSNISIETNLYTGAWWGHGEPIHVSTEYNSNADRVGTIKNVSFTNITARGESGILVYGCKDSVIQDLSFENLRLELVRGRLSEAYGGNFDLQPAKELKKAIFRHDECGIYACNTNNFTIRNFKLEWGEAMPGYFTSGIRCDGCDNLEIDGFSGRQADEEGSAAALTINSSRQVTIRNCRAAEGTGTFLVHSDLTDAGLFTGNDLSKAKVAATPAEMSFVQSGNKLPQKQ